MNIHTTIVTYNSERDIAACLAALAAQTHRTTVRVIDNASTDQTSAIVQASGVLFQAHTTNTGFAAAHNRGIAQALSAGADAVLVLNPDVMLAPDAVAQLVRILEREPQCGMAGGRLVRAQDPAIIDSDGIFLERNLHAVEIHAGEQLAAHPAHQSDLTRVFGISGAACLIRAQALRNIDIAGTGEYFDESFFIYKEDVDLCWRLWHAGWNALTTSATIGTHARGVKTNPTRRARDLMRLLTSRTRRARTEQFHSLKNQRLLVIKNAPIATLLRHAFSIILYEIKLLVLATVIQPALFRANIAVLRLLPQALHKRRAILAHSTRTSAEFEQFFRRIWISR